VKATPASAPPPATAKAPRPAAVAFIFITVTLDMLALGIMVPVLPKLIIEFEGGAIAAAARMPAAAAVAGLVAWYGLLGGARTIEGPLGSPVQVARIMERTRQPGEPVIELGAFSAGLPFYVGATIPMVDVPRSEAFESPGVERHAFLAESALPELIRRSGRVWVYGPRDRAAREADTLGVRYEVVARTRNRELGLLELMPPDSVAGR
jgi:hypothetical protein